LRFNKQHRLAILGSIARTAHVYEYNEKGKMISYHVKRDRKLQAVWSNICAGVTDLMVKCARDYMNLFLMFWCDNLFVLRFDPIIAEQINNAGYQYKLKTGTLLYKRSFSHIDVKFSNHGMFSMPLRNFS
jgi:hypothetical protein